MAESTALQQLKEPDPQVFATTMTTPTTTTITTTNLKLALSKIRALLQQGHSLSLRSVPFYVVEVSAWLHQVVPQLTGAERVQLITEALLQEVETSLDIPVTYHEELKFVIQHIVPTLYTFLSLAAKQLLHVNQYFASSCCGSKQSVSSPVVTSRRPPPPPPPPSLDKQDNKQVVDWLHDQLHLLQERKVETLVTLSTATLPEFVTECVQAVETVFLGTTQQDGARKKALVISALHQFINEHQTLSVEHKQLLTKLNDTLVASFIDHLVEETKQNSKAGQTCCTIL